MTPDQQRIFMAFIANMVDLLHQVGHSRACAEEAAQAASACLLPIVFGLSDTSNETTSDIVVLGIRLILDKFYGKEAVKNVC